MEGEYTPMNAEIIEKDLSFKIMKAAFEVHNQLGPGFSEKIYEDAMALQLYDDGMELEGQKSIKVYYKNRLIGEYILDLLVNKRIILELKAISNINPIHEQQGDQHKRKSVPIHNPRTSS